MMAIVYTSQLGLHQHLSFYIVTQCQDKIVCRGLWHCVSIFKNAKLGKAFNFKISVSLRKLKDQFEHTEVLSG